MSIVKCLSEYLTANYHEPSGQGLAVLRAHLAKEVPSIQRQAVDFGQCGGAFVSSLALKHCLLHS